MLWERSGALWRINEVRTNSALQLFTHDLARGSRIFFFDDAGRRTVLDAAAVTPWAP